MNDRNEIINLDHVVDEILAAGWRKRRTITTVEELDALQTAQSLIDGPEDPVPALIRDAQGVSHQRDVCNAGMDIKHGWSATWESFGFARDCASEEIPLPVTVLYAPEEGA
ncbi:hypothetical protein [Rhodococcus marinonascens]|uniref:hypothetical protein n=1 Tax=Rhodococcus marinonascens TaxID=38311 RepID=UPI000932CD5B|nr:hypothetical protein [Rhodococcus marinonascens]